jgi:hypothetical protein
MMMENEHGYTLAELEARYKERGELDDPEIQAFLGAVRGWQLFASSLMALPVEGRIPQLEDFGSRLRMMMVASLEEVGAEDPTFSEEVH